VAATGFLPRALSFLRALSHLERVTHRLGKTYMFNKNHLPHLERGYTQVIQPISLISFPYKAKKQQGSATNIQQQKTTPSQELRGHHSQLGQQHGFPKQMTDIFLNPTRLNNYGTFGFPNHPYRTDSRFWVSPMRDEKSTRTSNIDSMVLIEGVPAPPEIRTGLFGFQSCMTVFLQRSYEIPSSDSRRYSCKGHTRFLVQTVDNRMEEEPPSWINSTVLTTCASVDTCHP
jgi:hypothetical protein